MVAMRPHGKCWPPQLRRCKHLFRFQLVGRLRCPQPPCTHHAPFFRPSIHLTMQQITALGRMALLIGKQSSEKDEAFRRPFFPHGTAAAFACVKCRLRFRTWPPLIAQLTGHGTVALLVVAVSITTVGMSGAIAPVFACASHVQTAVTAVPKKIITMIINNRICTA